MFCCTQELSEKVGVGGKLCSVVHKSCRSRLVLVVSCVLLCTRFASKLCLVCLLLVYI